MKPLFLILNISLLALLVISCAGNKERKQSSSLQPGQAYYTFAGDSLKLYIPVKSIEREVRLDSVYFRGRRLKLQQDSNDSGVFYASMNTGNRDFVMSGDPLEEYGNQPPLTSENIPFSLSQDEAVIVYRLNNNTGYLKLAGIKQKPLE